MNITQRKSTAKYMYDISKAIAIIAIVANIIQGKWEFERLLFGFISVVIFFFIAYIIEGGIKNG